MLGNKILLELMVKDSLTPVINAQIKDAKRLQKAYTDATRMAKVSNFRAGPEGGSKLPGGFGMFQGRGGGRMPGGLGGIAGMAGIGGPVVAGIAGAAMTAVGAVTSAVGLISEGARMQNDALTAAGDISRNLGMTLEASRNIVKKSQGDIEKYAAALPGDTKTYQTVFNGLVGAVAKTTKDPKELNDKTLALTKRLGAQAAVTDTDPNVMARSFAAVLAGNKSTGELRQIEGFARWPAFFDELDKAAAKEGLQTSKIKSWDPAKRSKLLMGIVNSATSEELLNAFADGVDGLSQSIKDVWTAPSSGVFGVMRDIVGKDGVTRNVMDATKSLLQSFKSFQDLMGKIAKTLGLSADPMAILIDIIDNIRYGIDSLALGLGRVSDVAKGWGSWAGTMDLGFKIGEMVGVWIGKLIAQAFSPKALATNQNGIAGLLGALPGLLWGMVKGAFMGLSDAWKPTVDGLVQMIRDGIMSLGARIRDSIGSMALNSLVPGGSAIAGAGSFLNSAIGNPLGSVADGIKGATGIDVGGMMGLPSAPAASGSSGAKTSTNNISINTPAGVTDPKAVAMFVVDYLENGYRSITQETLTA